MVAAIFWQTHSPSLGVGDQPSFSLHLSNELGELSQWLLAISGYVFLEESGSKRKKYDANG